MKIFLSAIVELSRNCEGNYDFIVKRIFRCCGNGTDRNEITRATPSGEEVGKHVTGKRDCN